MTNDELKKKIMNVINATDISVELRRDDIIIIADALIAAGIDGDISSYRVFAQSGVKDMTLIYNEERVEQIIKERDELKIELRSKVDYIHEQDEVIKEYKHRAEVAERALKSALNDDTCYFCNMNAPCKVGRDWGSSECIQSLLQQAEKELAEEGKE